VACWSPTNPSSIRSLFLSLRKQALASGGADAAAVLLGDEHPKEKDHASPSSDSDLARATKQRHAAWAALAAAAQQRKQQQVQGGGEQPPPLAPAVAAVAGRGSKAVAPLASQGKFGAIEALAFVDAGAVAPKLRGPPETGGGGGGGGGGAGEWHLAILLEHRVVLVDLAGSNGGARHVLPFHLHKHAATALEPLSPRFLALGCGDGQVRVWDTRRWELAAPPYPAHSKEVRLLRALLPGPNAHHHPSLLRFLSLGMEGGALLWHAPVVHAGTAGSGGLEVDPRALRPVMRLEGVYVEWRRG
jgi:hypothetical protein